MGIFPKLAKKPPKNPHPGYAGSEEAFYLALQLVKRVARKSEFKWVETASVNLSQWMAVNGTKMNDADFDFISHQMPHLWDRFRHLVNSSENDGRWSLELKSELTKIMIEEFTNTAPKNHGSINESMEAGILLILCLERCLQEEKQVLMNSIFEVILILRCHSSDPSH